MKKLLILLLVVAPLLAACGPKEETTPPPTDVATSPPVSSEETVESVPTPQVEKVTIRFAVDDLEQALYQDTIRAFEEDNPDIDIKLVSINQTLDLGAVGGEWPEDAMLRLAEAADVINVGASRDAVDAGLVLDLMPLIETHPNAHPEDFFPGTLSACQIVLEEWPRPQAV